MTWLFTVMNALQQKMIPKKPQIKTLVEIFFIIENRQGPYCFLHSFDVQESLKAVSSCFRVILRGVFVFYTPGGCVENEDPGRNFL